MKTVVLTALPSAMARRATIGGRWAVREPPVRVSCLAIICRGGSRAARHIQAAPDRLSAKSEGQLHVDQHRDRLALVGAGAEAPLLDGNDGLLIEAEGRVEGARDLDASR